MSSWTQQHQRQAANMTKQVPPPQAVAAMQQQQQPQQQHQVQQPQQVGVGGSSAHGITAHFGTQSVWQPTYNQQTMQPLQQPTPNNWIPNPLANVYQQQNLVATPPPQPVQHNNWPQQDLHQSALPGPPPQTQTQPQPQLQQPQSQPGLSASGYFLNQESFIQPPQQPQYHNLQQTYPTAQQYPQNMQQPHEVPFAAAPGVGVSYSRQSTQPMDNVQEATEFFDNKANNNTNNDGWGDWDWNDNNVQPHQPPPQQPHQPQPLQQQLQPPPVPVTDSLQNKANVLEDSFRTEANDNWQWGSMDESSQQRNNNSIPDDHYQNSQQPPPQEQGEKPAPSAVTTIKPTAPVVTQIQQKVVNVQPAAVGIQQQAVHSSAIVAKPTNLPLSDISQIVQEAQQSSNNIPSPVYVSQAKPVSKPPRQYASLPGAANDVASTVGPTTPPHAFQNRPDSQPHPSATPGPPPPSTTLPPPLKNPAPAASAATGNPFKRAGLPQHHRAAIVAAPISSQQPSVIMPPAQFYSSPPPPPDDFANPSVENHEVIAPDNSEVLHENQEIAPNNDRNEYLQTSHLSEIGGHIDVPFNVEMQEQNNESDDFPPPGLSRLVLGQPENESRQIPGTDTDSNLNIERQADGEDTDPAPQRSIFPPAADGQSNVSPNQIDITADRNLYLVPGESDVQEQRVVTGLENGSSAIASVPPIQVEQRELELDGENIEDQQQPPPSSQTAHHHSLHHHHRPVSPVQVSRDEPLEGGNSLDRQVQGSQHTNHETESSMTVETNAKDLSNISTGNEESDQRDRHYNKSRRGAPDDSKKRRPGNESKERRYESEESEFSSERERRKYREGSVRSERDRERDSKERKRRDRRGERDVADRDRDRERDRGRVDDRENRYREKYYRDRDGRPERGNRYGSGRYDADSKYETEGSTRHDRRRGGDRSERNERAEREYEEYRRYRKYNNRDERDHDRRDGARVDVERRRSERQVRDDRDPRRHKDQRDKPRGEYEEYRKTSSRNARESDIEKESRLREKDPRYAAHNMYGAYTGYGYDPYAAYYYEQLVRTNPHAEWYKKYYGQAQASESITNEGRESVHSGRSSANNDKDRYSMQHHQYIPHPNDYHRHFLQPTPSAMAGNMSMSMNSTMIETQQPIHHLHHQQQQTQQGGYGLSAATSTGNLSQINQLPGVGYYASSARSYYARSEYSESRPDNLSLNLVDATSSSNQQDPQRLTPHKFTTDHSCISMAPGLLITCKPQYSHNGITNVVKIFKLGTNDATGKLYQSYPGPLIRGLTHKKTIIEFCEEQIRLGPSSAANRSKQNSLNSLSTTDHLNRPSSTLMWNLLILLLRQNGMVVGTDIAELLIKNQQQFPYETPAHSVSSSSNRRESQQFDDQPRKSKENTPSDPEEAEIDDLAVDERDESDESNSKASSLSEEEITKKFRNYLIYGNVNEALEWATDNNLWGHALFLASKMDRRSHANVMMKFANKLSLNDPLQTLYQLMSGRMPSSVTSIQDEKWGDWRPHLAMILSNTSQKPELDRKAITTLGDSLFNRGDLFAAHFCYLMAQVGFSKYPEEQSDSVLAQNSVRLVLLGSSHHKPFDEFSTDEAIMMTEVYEYACSLNDEKFSLVEFQYYKFLLAIRMLDYGQQLRCLMYMEQIFLHIQRDPTKYEPGFIRQVYDIADRLKFYDPVLEKSMEEVQADSGENDPNEVPLEEQKWLQELRTLANQQLQGAVTSQELNENYQQTSNMIDQQFTEINRQFQQLNMQYTPGEQHPTTQTHTDSQFNSNSESGNKVVPATEPQQYPQFYNPSDVYQTQTGGMDPLSYGNGYTQSQDTYQQPNYDTQDQAVYDPNQAHSVPTYGHDEHQQQQQNSYEYWGNQMQMQSDETARPTISMPNSVSQKSGFYDDGRALDDQATKTNDAKKVASQGSVATKNDAKNQSKGSGPNSNQNSGWFGGIWNKLSLKPKNQMILPDDKNPAIVWDPEKKKWVNTDGDEEGEESLKPPPKMSDLMPKVSQNLPLQQPQMQPQLQSQPQQYQQQPLRQHVEDVPQQMQPHQLQPQQLPSQPLQSPQPIPSPGPIQPQSSPGQMPAEPAKVPNLQSNMFKMQRNRTLKNSYVDVFNPSGAVPKNTEQILAPALPPATVPVGGFFVPGANPNDGAYQQQQQQQPQPASEGLPQFYNPNQFAPYQQQ